MSINVNTKASVSTFQNLDGKNFTTTGVDINMPIKNGNIGVYAGIGTEFSEGSTGAIFDVKGSVNYGDSPISGAFRVRNNLNGNSQTVQIRIQPATVTIPVGENANIYTTPYVAEKINYSTGQANTSFGIYGGISAKISNNVSIFVEGQMYDVTNVNTSTTSINAGVSVKF